MTDFSYLTIKDFCAKHPSFKEGGIRFRIFHSKTNGLAQHGAITRNGRTVLINEAKFFSWLESDASNASDPHVQEKKISKKKKVMSHIEGADKIKLLDEACRAIEYASLLIQKYKGE